MSQNNAPSDSKADKLDYFNSTHVSTWRVYVRARELLETNKLSVFTSRPAFRCLVDNIYSETIRICTKTDFLSKCKTELLSCPNMNANVLHFHFVAKKS